MIISIMKNIDLTALVSIANDPVENEVDGTTEKPAFGLGQLLTGDIPATTVETKVPETEPVSTSPSVESLTTTSAKQEDLTTTNNDEVNTAANVRIENGVHVVMPVGWFENSDDERKLHLAEVAETITTTTTAEEAPVTTTTAAPTTTLQVTTTTAAPIETEAAAAAVLLTTVPDEVSTITEEKPAPTITSSSEEAAEQVTTAKSEEVVEIVHGEVVATTAPSSDSDAALTTTNSATTTEIPESNRNVGGRKLPRVFRPKAPTSTTTRKTTTTEDNDAADGEGERSKFANQRFRIRERLRTQFNGGTSASKALEILNNRANAEPKEKFRPAEAEAAKPVPVEDDGEEELEAPEVEAGDEKVPPKIKKERMKLNVTKAVDRRNELFKKRVPITHPTPTKDEAPTTTTTQSTLVPIKGSSIQAQAQAPAQAQAQAQAGSNAPAAKPLFANTARRPFKFSAGAEAIPSELTATESSSTTSPESDPEKPAQSVRCRLFRRACTDEDLKATKS